MPATDWKETIPDDEAARFERHAELLGSFQARQAHAGRALHTKANLGVEATFEVRADIPAEARIGMFAAPRSYPAVVRFSNGAGRRQSDRKLDVRGIAVKLFGVAGKKVIPGMEDATTQDFLAIRTSVVPIKNADEFMAIVRAGQTPALLPLKLIGALGLRRGFQVIKAALGGLKAPQSPLAATSFYSALPIKFGAHAVQFAFTAKDPPAPSKIATATDLGDGLAARLRTAPVSYDFQVRFYVDEATTPIEDASIEWKAPWVSIGTLTLPVQDPASARGKKIADLVETLAFDPWHAREDLRPLGNIMRARNAAYRVSTKARNAAPEPREAPTFE
jgi:hypothetical protein